MANPNLLEFRQFTSRSTQPGFIRNLTRSETVVSQIEMAQIRRSNRIWLTGHFSVNSTNLTGRQRMLVRIFRGPVTNPTQRVIYQSIVDIDNNAVTEVNISHVDIPTFNDSLVIYRITVIAFVSGIQLYAPITMTGARIRSPLATGARRKTKALKPKEIKRNKPQNKHL